MELGNWERRGQMGCREFRRGLFLPGGNLFTRLKCSNMGHTGKAPKPDSRSSFNLTKVSLTLGGANYRWRVWPNLYQVYPPKHEGSRDPLHAQSA